MFKSLLFSMMTLLLFTGCAYSPEVVQTMSIEPVGFLHGVWHGMIAVIAFFVSLFDDSVAIYASYNSGGWYDFGFLLGVGSLSLFSF
jgi:hypothetical protein